MPTHELGDYTVEDDGNNDYVIKDPNGNIIFQWDNSIGEWSLNTNVLGGIDSLGGLSGTNLSDIEGTNLSVDANGVLNASGGSGSPGGSDTQLQYNDGGAFGGIAGFTYDDANTKLTGVPNIDAALVLLDQAADPTTNGEINLNGTDVKIYSGGSVRNVSNIGSGSATLTDSGTDTDGGNNYQLPQAADNIDLQGDGAIQDADKISNDNYVESQTTTSQGTSYTVDLAQSNYHKITLTGDVSIDFTNQDTAETNSVMLHLVQDSTGGRTPSFTPTVIWDSGSVPSWSTSANAEDVVSLAYDPDGSQWLGFVGGLGMA